MFVKVESVKNVEKLIRFLTINVGKTNKQEEILTKSLINSGSLAVNMIIKITMKKVVKTRKLKFVFLIKWMEK